MIIISAAYAQIAKVFRGKDYQQLKFSPGSKFLVSQQHVHDLHSLASVIGGLETEPTKTVLRGLPLLPNKDIIANKSQNFSTASRQWCMIDIDSLSWNGFLQGHRTLLNHTSSQLLPRSGYLHSQ